MPDYDQWIEVLNKVKSSQATPDPEIQQPDQSETPPVQQPPQPSQQISQFMDNLKQAKQDRAAALSDLLNKTANFQLITDPNNPNPELPTTDSSNPETIASVNRLRNQLAAERSRNLAKSGITEIRPMEEQVGKVVQSAGKFTKAGVADAAQGWVNFFDPNYKGGEDYENLKAATKGEELPVDQTISQMSQPAKTLSSIPLSIAEITPQVAAAGVMERLGVPPTVANFEVFGLTPEGFSIKEGLKMAALPHVGGIGEKVADNLIKDGVVPVNTIAGMEALRNVSAGSLELSYLRLASSPEFDSMTPEQRRDWWLDNAGMIFAMRAPRMAGLAGLHGMETDQDQRLNEAFKQHAKDVADDYTGFGIGLVSTGDEKRNLEGSGVGGTGGEDNGVPIQEGEQAGQPEPTIQQPSISGIDSYEHGSPEPDMSEPATSIPEPGESYNPEPVNIPNTLQPEGPMQKGGMAAALGVPLERNFPANAPGNGGPTAEDIRSELQRRSRTPSSVIDAQTGKPKANLPGPLSQGKGAESLGVPLVRKDFPPSPGPMERGDMTHTLLRNEEAIRNKRANDPNVIAQETGWSFKPTGIVNTEGLPPELIAQLPKSGWEFTDRRKGSPTEGFTTYVPEGSNRDTILNAIKAKASEVNNTSIESQINTQNFKDWFGNSKIIDNNGKPIIVYHGTDSDFQSFKQAKEGSVGKGIYFTPDPRVASSYSFESANAEKRKSGSNVVPAFVRIERPIEVSLSDNPNPATSVLIKLGYDGKKANEIAEKALEEKGNITNEIQSKAISKGYDGIIVRKPDGTIHEVVAFDPRQIKSAIGNSGKFDRSSQNILESDKNGAGINVNRDSTYDDVFERPGVTLGSLLQEVIVRNPEYADLANKILRSGAHALVIPVDNLKNQRGVEIAGRYNPMFGKMEINKNIENAAQTIMHEAVHAATIFGYGKDAKFRSEMDGLYDFLNERWAETKGKEEKPYGLMNAKEMIAEAFTDKDFRDFLNSFEFSKRESFWQKLLGSILDFLGIKRSTQNETALDKIVSSSEKMFMPVETTLRAGDFLESKLRDKEKASDIFTGKEADKPGSGEEFIRSQQAAEVVASTPFVQKAIDNLRSIAGAKVDPKTDPEAAIKQKIAQRVLSDRYIKTQMAEPLQNLRDSSSMTAGKLENYFTLKADPNASPEIKSRAALDALHVLDLADRAYYRFKATYESRKKALEDKLTSAMEAKDWANYKKGTLDVLTSDLKSIGRAIIEGSGDKAALSVFEKISSRTDALKNAVGFIANTADFNLINRGVIKNAKDLLAHLSNEVQKTHPDQTMEQAAGANAETLKYVSDLVMMSEPLRESLMEGQMLLRDKSLAHPLTNFINQIRKLSEDGKYTQALNTFRTGVGKTAVEADKVRRAANFFAKAERDTLIQMSALDEMNVLYQQVRTDPDFRMAQNAVYNDLGIRSVMRGISGDAFVLKAIRPDADGKWKDVVINFGDSSSAAAKSTLEAFQKYKEDAAEYLRDTSSPDYNPAKAASLKEFLRQYDIYVNPSMNPEAGRLLPGPMKYIPRKFFGLVGGIDQIPDVVLRYGGGLDAEMASRTLNALATAKEVGQASFFDHQPRMAKALKEALNSHGFTQKDIQTWKEKVFYPLAGSRQYFENIGMLDANSPVGNGLNVTKEDISYLRAVRDYEKSIIAKLTATDEHSYGSIQNFPAGVVETIGKNQRTRLPAETGPETVNRRVGSIMGLVRDWQSLKDQQSKIAFLNKNLDRLVIGYLADAGRASFNHSYSFEKESRAVFNEGRTGNPIGSMDDLFDRIAKIRNLEADGEAISKDDVAKPIISEFDKLMGKLSEDYKVYLEKSKVKTFGGENSLNTPRGNQIVPSSWYDYGSVTDPEHIAYLNTSLSKFYIDHLNSVEALHRALTEIVGRFENLQRENPESNIHKTSRENRIEGKDYYSWGEAITAQQQVAGYLDKLRSAYDAERSAFSAVEHGLQTSLGQTAADVVVSSLLSGPQANIFNSFGGGLNIILADMALRNHAWYYALPRNIVAETPRFFKELVNLVFGNKMVEKIPSIGPLAKSMSDYLSGLRGIYDTGRRDGVVTSKDLGLQLSSMWDFRHTGGSVYQKNPTQGPAGDLYKSGETLVRMGTKALKAATVMFVDSRINVGMAYRQALEIEKDLERRAIQYGRMRVLRANEEGRDPYDPSDPNNLFSPNELIKNRWINNNMDPATAAARLRDFMMRDVDLNLDSTMMDFYKRYAEAGEDKNGDVRLLTDNQRRQLSMALASYGNLATFGNRPISAKTGKTQRFLSMFLGYPAFQLTKMAAATDRFSRDSYAKGLGKAVPYLVGMAIVAAIVGSTAQGLTEAVKREMYNKYGNVPTIFDIHGGTGLASALATGAAATFPFYGSMFNLLSGNQFRKGFDLNSQFVFMNLATDATKLLKEMWQTNAIERPVLQFARRWTFPANYLGGFLPQISGLQEFTNAKNLLSRAAKANGMESFLRNSGGSDINFGPTTALLNEFMNAVGKGDKAGAKSAFQSIVDYYQKEKGLSPDEAHKRAVSSVNSRNPVNSVFNTKITDGQLSELYGKLSDKEKSLVGRMLGNYESAIHDFGGNAKMVKAAAKAPGGRAIREPVTLAQRALSRRMKIRSRSPLSRISSKTGIREPKVSTTKSKRTRNPV